LLCSILTSDITENCNLNAMSVLMQLEIFLFFLKIVFCCKKGLVLEFCVTLSNIINKFLTNFRILSKQRFQICWYALHRYMYQFLSRKSSEFLYLRLIYFWCRAICIQQLDFQWTCLLILCFQSCLYTCVYVWTYISQYKIV
jgi:hypothetical protein